MTELSNQQTLSTPMTNIDDRSELLARLAAEAADERKGSDIVLLKVGDVTVLADYFVLVSGYSKVQVRAIARSIEQKIEETMNLKPIRSEGFAEGSWVVEDFGDVIVHVMMPQEREYYGLESFWGHAARIPVGEF
ncbi:ribosome silencing factor [Leptolyngbya sp. NIES-2104]|uniref:ribosome silencing factor n=1 Tax=Leptolyngbya sp. NIES-2104 TaxID=1552121 RepID=UPI0006EC71F8|nr:ribosome silencing factor [Leptolyngbya sp. NIES-2104]GAP95852.1 ribosomal silencing factor RsfA [Leptolyngbya sp. NIES-2104]